MAQHDVSSEQLDQQTALSHLASGVGHHVINAFSAIVSNAEILRLSTQSGHPVDAGTIADLIVRTAMDSSAVARRLIDFTRPMTAPGPEMVSLDELAVEVVEELKQLWGPEVCWQLKLTPIPLIPGQAHQLRIMLFHLLTNAYESLPKGQGTITVSAALDARQWVVLELRDNGLGMTAEVQEHAVEPFFTTKPGHYGIGLSIANGIWRRHRGTLAIQSLSHAGTTVRLCVHPNSAQPSRRSTGAISGETRDRD